MLSMDGMYQLAESGKACNHPVFIGHGLPTIVIFQTAASNLWKFKFLSGISNHANLFLNLSYKTTTANAAASAIRLPNAMSQQ
jgi:hypothetical protein